MPSREDWSYWKDHPCTHAMVEILREWREEAFTEVSTGSDDHDLIRLGIKIGKVNSLTGMIKLGFIPEEEEQNDS